MDRDFELPLNWRLTVVVGVVLAALIRWLG